MQAGVNQAIKRSFIVIYDKFIASKKPSMLLVATINKLTFNVNAIINSNLHFFLLHLTPTASI